MPSLNQTIKDIRAIKIQGASNVARASILAWRDYVNVLKIKNPGAFLREAKRAGEALANARPDEPLAVNIFKYLNDRMLQAARIKKILMDTPSQKKLARQYADDLLAMLGRNTERIAAHGAKIIGNKDNVFTHCHSKTVINILTAAKSAGKKFHVYNDETRPLLQGRLTAEDLAERKITNTLVVDAAASFLVSDLSGDEIKINKIIIGFDMILPDGSALNKIGSFGIALAAVTSKIPVYLAGTLLKKTNKKNKIELRRKEEVWAKGPQGLEIINYAFDRIPRQFITGYITEFGIIKPNEVDKYVKKYYPWVLGK